MRVHDVGERHFDVEVVLIDRIGEWIAFDFAFDDLAVGFEFGRRTVGDADHLRRPRAADLVAQLVARKRSERLRHRHGRRPQESPPMTVKRFA